MPAYFSFLRADGSAIPLGQVYSSAIRFSRERACLPPVEELKEAPGDDSVCAIIENIAIYNDGLTIQEFLAKHLAKYPDGEPYLKYLLLYLQADVQLEKFSSGRYS